MVIVFTSTSTTINYSWKSIRNIVWQLKVEMAYIIMWCMIWIDLFSPFVLSSFLNKEFIVFENYSLNNTSMEEISLRDKYSNKFKCFTKCLQMPECKSISLRKDLLM